MQKIFQAPNKHILQNTQIKESKEILNFQLTNKQKMNQNDIKSGTQIDLYDKKDDQNNLLIEQQTQNTEKKEDDQPRQLRKSSRIQSMQTKDQQSQQTQKRLPPKVRKNKKNDDTLNTNNDQTTLNCLPQDNVNNKLEPPKINSQSMLQEVSSIQSTNASPNIFVLPKQDHAQFQKIISDLNCDLIVSQLEQFNSFISSLLQNIISYFEEKKCSNLLKNDISQNTINKIEKQIKFILFRFLTSSPFQMWYTLYCPQRVSQLIEEVNGKYIQLWIRKYYKGIKDKLKCESLFGSVDSDDDFSEYFNDQESNSNINEEYQHLLQGNICRNWKNKGNILVLNGKQGCGKTTALRSAIKSLKIQIIEINNSTKRGGVDIKKINEITQSCRLNNNQSNEKQQVSQKGTLNAFFAPKKKQNQNEDEFKDQIKIDAKDSSKKVIYFRNFDIQLDTLFQNEVIKISENSKVPFILSTNISGILFKFIIFKRLTVIIKLNYFKNLSIIF